MLPAAPLLNALAARMAYGAAQDAQLSTNIANASTPKYIPGYLQEPASFGATLALARTHPDHQNDDAALTGGYARVSPSGIALTPDGNGVDLAHEMFLKDQNATHYQMATMLYRKYEGWMRTALGSNATNG
jgi:flagellar basal-body rod protein FlgB